MHKIDYRRFKINKVILANSVMVLAVLLIVTALVLVTMGYSLTRDGKVEQTGLVQFGSYPTGATVKIDDEVLFSKTTTKSTLLPGEHSFSISHDGYDSWNKKAEVFSGRVLWLNYTRLIPTKKVNKSVKQYETLYKMSASPRSQYVLFLWPAPEVTTQLLDVRGGDVKTQDLQIAQLFSELDTESVQHNFQVKSWNQDENKVLVTHTYGENSEWVWIDLKTPANSVNLTNEYKMALLDAQFTSNDGNKLLVLEGSNLRRANIGDKTVSAVQVDNVLAISHVSDDGVLLIVDNPTGGTRSFSFYKNNDRGASEIYSLDAQEQPVLNVVGGKYYDEDYVAISEDDKLQILKGDYPKFNRANNSLNYIVDIKLEWPIERLELSANKRFVYAINKQKIYNYDLENQIGHYFTLDGDAETTASLNWLDNYMLWTDNGGHLTVYDFDGANKRKVQQVEPGFKVVLANGGKWLYNVVKNDAGYKLQRLQMTVN